MTPRFLADENIDLDVVLGLRRRVEDVDVLRVQDVELRTMGDPEILQQTPLTERQLRDLFQEPHGWRSRRCPAFDWPATCDDHPPVPGAGGVETH